jgi:SPP1 gp7 family putative phage head morphogenesis protein
MGALKTFKPVHPNAGIEAAYSRQLLALIDQMNKSVNFWVLQAYKTNAPEIAMDASPAFLMRVLMKRLSRYWLKKFSDRAPDLAKSFTKQSGDYTTRAFMDSLKQAGFAIEFKMTAAMNDVAQATVNANVALIKSIPQRHLAEVEGIVMRSVQTGRDLGTLSKELQANFGVTRRRAQFISRDQNNKATAAITKVRQKEAGITEAVWMHSNGGNEPRQEHVKWGAAKKTYKIDEGMYSEVEGKFIYPGERPNCRCISRPVIPGLSYHLR